MKKTTTTRVEIDTGKGEISKLAFPLIEKIKGCKEGIDYTVNKSGDCYAILSEKLKKDIWPDDYYPYDYSYVVIDKQGLVQGWRLVSLRESSVDPNRELHRQISRGGFNKLVEGVEELRSNDSKNFRASSEQRQEVMPLQRVQTKDHKAKMSHMTL